MKKEYETVWEIFNECANNQMRDVFFDEIETDDPEAYIRQKFPDKNLKYEKYKNKKCFILGLHDNITGTKNAIFFIFEHSNKLKVSIDCFDFGDTKQELEINLLINDEKITINEEEPFNLCLVTILIIVSLS